MALILSVLPPAVRQAMVEGFPRFLRPVDPPSNVLLDVQPGHLYCMRASTLELKDVKGPGISRARQAGWRLLWSAPSFPAVAGVVTQTRAGARPRMTSLLRGPQVAHVFQAARELESRLEVHVLDYQLEILSVPALLIEGFWLRSLSGEPDQMVPFHSLSPEVELNWFYPMETCINIMRPLAEKFEAFGH